MVSEHHASSDLALTIGREHLEIDQRYETLSIINDLLIAVWFIVGSILFFYPAYETAALWCFLLGSIELGVRPVLRLSRRIHLTRRGAFGPSNARDF